ncbi:DHA2 family efflux MFS transporter permease subunit [Limosilactobacillus equigenerosi]|uniref:MFS family major facilitator transporter n=2 Tax=Limosilactobacillus TaxID=2742598 RepID=A0A0R1UL20_9LACO|nr:MFS family major facilitator transporter [Limosilactobacillus equigenerosi DSM 18793 = JCM 14505]
MQQNVLRARVEVDLPWFSMAGMLLGAFVGMFSETSLNIAVPQLVNAFHTSTATIQWLITGYMLVIGIIMPLTGIISKWFSTRQVVSFALIAFILGSVISATAPNFAIVLTGRMIQGIGTGLILPMMFATAMLIFPPQKLGAVNGMLALVIMFAPAIGPTLTGIILGVSSWRWIFWIFAIILAIALILTLAGLKNVNELTKPHVDVLSICESIIGFSGLVAGASLAGEQGWGSPLVIASLIIGVIVLILYTRRQLRLEHPVLNLRVMKNEQFALGVAVVMLDFGIILSAMFLLPQFIQNAMLLPVAMTGMVMLPGGIVNAITSGVAGRSYEQFGAKRLAVLGFIIAFIGVLILIMAPASAPVWLVILAHVIMMIGAPMAMSPSQTSALSALQGPEAGDGSTIMNTLQQVVGALATAIATSCLGFGIATGHGSVAAKAANGVHVGLYFTLALIVIAFVLSFFLSGKPAEEGHDITPDDFK